jgi:hypothetical protein
MHSALQFFLDCSQPGPHPIAARLSLELKDALPGSAADVSKPKEVKCLSLLGQNRLQKADRRIR